MNSYNVMMSALDDIEEVKFTRKFKRLGNHLGINLILDADLRCFLNGFYYIIFENEFNVPNVFYFY